MKFRLSVAGARSFRETGLLAVVVALTVGAVALLGYVLDCLTRLRVSRIEIDSCAWPVELDGTRIAFLSDFHFGSFGTSRRVIARAIDTATNFAPDITVLGGDYFDGAISAEDVALLEPLRRHNHVVAVIGNHDYMRGCQHFKRTMQIMEAVDAVVLRNEAHRVNLCASAVWVVGLDDPFTLRDDIERASASLPAHACPVLLVAHAPVLAAFGDLSGVAVALSGHTHGGQIRLLPSGDVPGKRLLRWLVRESGPWREPDIYRGVHHSGSTAIVISEGLGVSLLPIRFRTRPELVLITIHASTPHRQNS